MKTIFKITALSAILLILAGTLVSCKSKDKAEIFTQTFTVFLSVNLGEHEGCGFLLHRGDNPSLMHARFVWAETLPEEFQVEFLSVVVTYYYTGNKCGYHPAINIIKIKKS